MKSFPTKVGFPVLVFITTFRFSPIVTFFCFKMQVQEIIIIIYIFMTLASLQLLLIYNFQICVPKKKYKAAREKKKIVSARPHPLEDELTVKCCLFKIKKKATSFFTLFYSSPFLRK